VMGRGVFWKAAFLGVVVFVITGTLLPIYWMATTSVKPPGEYVSKVPTLVPKRVTFVHYGDMWEHGFFRHLRNTATVAIGSTLLSLAAGFFAAYAVVRFRVPARLHIIFMFWVLIVKMLPPVVIAIPLYKTLRFLGLLDSLPGLVIVYQVYTLPYCIWMLLGFVKEVPQEFEEAASLDGASTWQILRYVVLPLVGPGLVAAGIFSAIIAWNEFIYALLFVHFPARLTLQIHIANYITEHEILWGELMAIGLSASLPVLFASVYVQRYLVRGFTMSLR
jgi:multiple sugar transport system permease protein